MLIGRVKQLLQLLGSRCFFDNLLIKHYFFHCQKSNKSKEILTIFKVCIYTVILLHRRCNFIQIFCALRLLFYLYQYRSLDRSFHHLQSEFGGISNPLKMLNSHTSNSDGSPNNSDNYLFFGKSKLDFDHCQLFEDSLGIVDNRIQNEPWPT